ncbi:MAG: hypothetical protein HY261_01205 [Chloroflexi bacterium]|nr:hypothetical protein [Chloroflexota bacterium]
MTAIIVIGAGLVALFVAVLTLRYAQARRTAKQLLDQVGDRPLTIAERRDAVQLVRVLRFGIDGESKFLTRRLLELVLEHERQRARRASL